MDKHHVKEQQYESDDAASNCFHFLPPLDMLLLQLAAQTQLASNTSLSGRPPTVEGRAVGAILHGGRCGTARSSIADRYNDS
jgi:hypothetical protein